MSRPSEQRGGTNVGDQEAREKGEWVENAADGIVPADLGGSDAPDDDRADDPHYRDEALGRTTGDDSPATAEGIDKTDADNADATSDGGGDPSTGDLKDAAQP
jgi:hypothetical protein